jgi:mannose-binding lectin
LISIDIYSYEADSSGYRIRPLDEEFLMTYDSDSRTGQAYLTDALLWLAGAPLALLDAAYLAYAAPPITPSAPETLVVWVLALVGLALLAWGLLSSALAHLATLRLAPAGLRRATRFLVTRFGTSLSRSLLARAGASALIGSAMLTAAPIGAALASPRDADAPDMSLTWADTPDASPSPGASPQDATDATPASSPTVAPAPSSAPPDAASRGASDPPQTHTVAPGDTLWSIAEAMRPGADDAHITRVWQAIHAANAEAIPNPSLIYPGQRLTIPQDLP